MVYRNIKLAMEAKCAKDLTLKSKAVWGRDEANGKEGDPNKSVMLCPGCAPVVEAPAAPNVLQGIVG
jgi:hypothetical protein